MNALWISRRLFRAVEGLRGPSLKNGSGYKGHDLLADGFAHGSLLCLVRSLPRAREAKTPPEQRKAEITKVILIHFRKER